MRNWIAALAAAGVLFAALPTEAVAQSGQVSPVYAGTKKGGTYAKPQASKAKAATSKKAKKPRSAKQKAAQKKASKAAAAKAKAKPNKRRA